MLRGPEILPIANAFDGNIWEECPQDSVIVGAYSEHDNKYHDRRWQFYCSQVIEVRSYFAEVSDVVVSSVCDFESVIADKQDAFHTQDNTDSSYPTEAPLLLCFEKSIENQISRTESTCSSETLKHTNSFTSSVSNEFSVSFSGGFGHASLTTTYRLLLELSATWEVTEETSEEICSEVTQATTTTKTLTDCKSCSVKVPAGGCSNSGITATFEQSSWSCKEVHEITALNVDGSVVEYWELKEFFHKVGMEASPYQADSDALRYIATADVQLAYRSYSECKQEDCAVVPIEHN